MFQEKKHFVITLCLVQEKEIVSLLNGLKSIGEQKHDFGSDEGSVRTKTGRELTGKCHYNIAIIAWDLID